MINYDIDSLLIARKSLPTLCEISASACEQLSRSIGFITRQGSMTDDIRPVSAMVCELSKLLSFTTTYAALPHHSLNWRSQAGRYVNILLMLSRRNIQWEGIIGSIIVIAPAVD
jgi:hypothetical protein